MKNVFIILFALVSVQAFAQVPSVPADSVNQVNAKAADANAKAADVNSKATSAKNSAAEKIMVNVNTATPEQLAKLPGIGPQKAKAIVAARPFNSAQDLLKVKGIKEATLSKIKDKISF